MKTRTERVFWLVLPLVTLLGLGLRIVVGQKTFISFDEWQHVFMASSARWADLGFELETNAHPPLFFLLLAGIVKLGNVALYRSISIASGAGSIIVVGVIAKKVLHSPVMQLVCAAAFALSFDAISISVEIRSYQLAVFLALLAFLSWLELFRETAGPAGIRYCVTFAICSSLAVSTHYSAIFFLGAAAVVTPLAWQHVATSHGATTPGRRPVWLVASALAFPCAVFLIEYSVHARLQPIQGYLAEFYRRGVANETLTAFTIRNAGNFFNLFSPIELHSVAAFMTFIALGAAILVVFFRRRSNGSGRELVVIFAAVVVLEIFAASLLNRYPFGGVLRHQYIAGPFLLIAGFAITDRLVSHMTQALRTALPVFLLTASVVNLYAEWPKLIVYPGVVLLNDEFNAWRSALPDANAVYLDHWGVIAYFIHTSERPRTFVRRIADDAVIDEYHIPAETPSGTDIFYDKSRNSLDLSDASVYRSFADCLRGYGVRELSLFFYSPGDKPLDQEKLKASMVQNAAAQGLIISKEAMGETYAFAAFRLR